MSSRITGSRWGGTPADPHHADWHWLEWTDGRRECWLWLAGFGMWVLGPRALKPTAMAKTGARYLGRALPPDEVRENMRASWQKGADCMKGRCGRLIRAWGAPEALAAAVEELDTEGANV